MSNKINIVRSMKTKNIYNNDPVYIKEIGWDDRFHLGKLRNYETNKEQNSIFMVFLFLEYGCYYL